MKALFDHLAQSLAAGDGCILCQHRVLPEEQRSPFSIPRDLEVTPELLEGLLRACGGELGYEFVALSDIPRRLALRRRPRLLAVTFDDGYRDNLEHALPVMRRLGIPFTVYVTTGFVAGDCRGWWHELEDWLAQRDRLLLPGATEALVGRDVSTPDRKEALYRETYRFLRAQGPGVAGCMARLREANGLPPPGRDPRIMGWEDLHRLASDPLVEIGAHTRTHPRLSWLDEAAVREELEASRRELEAALGRPVRHLAYPHGAATDLPPGIERLASEAGFATAVTTEARNLRPSDKCALHRLPRRAIGGQVPGIARATRIVTGAADLAARPPVRWLRRCLSAFR